MPFLNLTTMRIFYFLALAFLLAPPNRALLQSKTPAPPPNASARRTTSTYN